MKIKIFIIMLFGCLFLTGCGNNNIDNVVDNLTKKVNDLKSYSIEGNLEIVNNDDVFNYRVKVDHQASDYYKVSLLNVKNNHEQIILKNDDGVYVVTPSLNKSFKFQSEWPYNNSQVYILGNIITDINEDSNNKVTEDNGDYVIESTVNFPNNANLVKQRVTVSNDLVFKRVEILNEDDMPLMTFTIDSVNYKPLFDESYFEINSIINNSEVNENNNENNNSSDKTTNESGNNSNNESGNKTTDEQTSTLDDIIYPLYIPTGTALTNEEKVSKTDGERVILTFGGEKSFTLVEETVNVSDEFTVVPTYGEPFLLVDTMAALTSNSINWVSNGIEYYIVSDVMNQTELIKVAESLSTVASIK